MVTEPQALVSGDTDSRFYTEYEILGAIQSFIAHVNRAESLSTYVIQQFTFPRCFRVGLAYNIRDKPNR